MAAASSRKAGERRKTSRTGETVIWNEKDTSSLSDEKCKGKCEGGRGGGRKGEK